MEKIALITDSASDQNEEIIKKYNINILPFRIIYKDREYIDKVNITPAEIYANMKNEIPKSSLPSMKDMKQIYERLEKENYTHVIGIVISSGLSGTYNALKLVSGNHKKLQTYIYDSKSASIGEGIILEETAKLIEKGKTFNEIVNNIPKIRNKMHFFFVMGTLEYAKKGGRIGKISGAIGEILKIKPIIGFDHDGVCFTYEKVRGRIQSLHRLVEIGSKIVKAKKCDVYIVHGNAEEEAHKVYEILSKLPNIEKTYFVGQISTVVGVYSGPGTVGVCYKEL